MASKELTIGYINLVSGVQNMMAIAPQKFAEKLITKFESNADMQGKVRGWTTTQTGLVTAASFRT